MEFLKANWKKIAIAVVVLVVIYVAYTQFFAKDKDEADNTKLGVPAIDVKASSTDPKVQSAIEKIYATPDWLKLAKDNAVKKGITESESVLAEATWTANKK